MADKTSIDGQELEYVDGGSGVNGSQTMIVTNTVALMPQPYWDAGQALTTLWAGTPVTTFGITTVGTGPNGESCSYTYVAGNNCMGWLISSFLR
jgi:hypothetical protein